MPLCLVATLTLSVSFNLTTHGTKVEDFVLVWKKDFVPIKSKTDKSSYDGH